MKKLVLISSVCLLSACGSVESIKWAKLDYNEAQFKRDQYQCMAESKSIGSDGTYLSKRLFIPCMTSKGYAEVQ